MEDESKDDESLPDSEHYDLMLSGSLDTSNKSYTISKSKVQFPKEGMSISNNGAIMQGDKIFVNSNDIKEIKRIGSGSAGEVYLAQCPIQGKLQSVAIKEIPLDTDKCVRDQFFNDLKLFLKSDNPYLVRFHGCFYKQGYLHQILEYMDMGSLRNLIKYLKSRGNALIEPVLSYFSYHILSGLLYLQKLNQIHRDIKPENILVNSKGQIKITDFGISKALGSTFMFTRTHVGTMIYMSPERILTKQYTYNCDIWSFGLILYEMATFRDIPYVKKPDDSEIILMKRIEEAPPPTFEATDQRSDDLKHFLSRWQNLQRDPNCRANLEELFSHRWMTQQLAQLQPKHFRYFISKIAEDMRNTGFI